MMHFKFLMNLVAIGFNIFGRMDGHLAIVHFHSRRIGNNIRHIMMFTKSISTTSAENNFWAEKYCVFEFQANTNKCKVEQITIHFP